ncbi:phosphotransferase system, mannose/fructose/N-acetylgalactosamine-specific component IID [Desulfomonile tiedjei DSM 6799]|uniref:Phosphotransferase system, mannose/fructose/N-acetylgalactosamine-specific component IID n=2 Tax=Desulfomonile tiedjei TaxID=2358 RepID=I4CAU2_DESTA|nr:PTS system mannose/fructose/sorbose family transporter subunit IID [Desulfomonile tiedjei]AFM26683.1 phosphotransferase system, mannose/fructose/N-acetylgalactosamine-specific component IID [Desulfomonile tiedjei DSM 6799]
MRGVNRRVFERSFLMEVLWNYEKKQNIGFVFCFFPALERLYPDEEERREAIRRHLEPVNTHPSMGPLLAGLTARLEHDLEPSTIIPYRKRIMATLAAYGDRFFWSHLKPLAAVCGTLFGFLFFGSVVGIVILLATYNLPQFFLRGRGFLMGWTEGLQILQILKSPGIAAIVASARDVLAVALGLLTGLILYLGMKVPVPEVSVRLVAGGGLFVAALAAVALFRLQMPPAAVIYLIALGVFSIFVFLQTGMLVV